MELGKWVGVVGEGWVWQTKEIFALPSLECHLRSSPWERRVLFPLSILCLLLVTFTALLLVATNCLYLTFDPSSTPHRHSVQDYLLGSESMSSLGALGAALEVIIILYPFPGWYLWCSTLLD